jgi:hypothetical protein
MRRAPCKHIRKVTLKLRPWSDSTTSGHCKWRFLMQVNESQDAAFGAA